MFIEQTRDTLISYLDKKEYEVRDIDRKHISIFRVIGQEADRLGRECYVIGGFVRDIFLGIESKDIDCVTVGSGIELAEHLTKRLGRKHTHLSTFRNFGTAQVKHTEMDFKTGEIKELMNVEFVGARKESYRTDSRKPVVEDGTLQDDQNRRDLTINDLAICLNAEHYGELIDPFNGLDDLKEGLCRTPLDPDITFSDDPLRMLRAIRFACRFDFKIVPETFEAIARNRERIKIISGERIIEELNKIQMCEKPSKGWYLLQKCGLLQIIFPELAALDIVDHKRDLAGLDGITWEKDPYKAAKDADTRTTSCTRLRCSTTYAAWNANRTGSPTFGCIGLPSSTTWGNRRPSSTTRSWDGPSTTTTSSDSAWCCPSCVD